MNIFARTQWGDTLKATCPLIYDDAVCCSSIIKEWTGITINDDEISYIAFHLGSTLETQKALASKLSAVIYCPTYYIMSNRLLQTISGRLDTELLIANVITEEADLDKITMPDLIISTVPINRALVTPFVQVQPFLMESDVTAIRQKIDEIRTSKKREKFTTYLRQIILPDFFERGEGFESREMPSTIFVKNFAKRIMLGKPLKKKCWRGRKCLRPDSRILQSPILCVCGQIRQGCIYICAIPPRIGMICRCP